MHAKEEDFGSETSTFYAGGEDHEGWLLIIGAESQLRLSFGLGKNYLGKYVQHGKNLISCSMQKEWEKGQPEEQLSLDIKV